MTQTEIFLKMVMDRWNASLKDLDKFLNGLKNIWWFLPKILSGNHIEIS